MQCLLVGLIYPPSVELIYPPPPVQMSLQLRESPYLRRVALVLPQQVVKMYPLWLVPTYPQRVVKMYPLWLVRSFRQSAACPNQVVLAARAVQVAMLWLRAAERQILAVQRHLQAAPMSRQAATKYPWAGRTRSIPRPVPVHVLTALTTTSTVLRTVTIQAVGGIREFRAA